MSQSTPAIIELSPLSVTSTVAGASSDVVTSRDELPMCMHTGTPASFGDLPQRIPVVGVH